MQRYHATNCTSAVNNSAIGGSARDTARAEPSSIPPNYSLNSRRSLQLAPYKLRCDKESLNSRLAPPDFHPQTPNCPEETLTREYVQSGYKEIVEGLEEAREISLSQVQTFAKPTIVKCKEALRKYHRAINESRAQKRKAGQVYGVPLSGTLLTKPSIPEQRPCSEEFRKKWIEGLSQPHKRLRSLSDHVPHGYRRKSLFEVLIRNNVPLLKAAWFIKVTYLNQVRPGSSSLSSGVPDKTQFVRSEQWTKDIIDYLQTLLDEFVSKSSSNSTMNIRDRSPQMVYTGAMHHRGDGPSNAADDEEPSLHFKWWYVLRILQWHHAEGLVVPSLIIDWVFNQLQEKELLGVLQLLLPVVYGVIEAVVLCQAYVRTLVGIAVRFIQEPSPGGSDLVDNSRRAYTTSALVEMLRYLILAVPDTFVALDVFPLPSCVVSSVVNEGNFLLKAGEGSSKIRKSTPEVACFQRDKGADVQYESISVDRAVSSIQKRREYLAKGVKPGHIGQNVAKALQALDRSLIYGDTRVAYKLLFENLCDGAADDCWISEVSSCLRTTLKHIGAVSSSFISSIFFICEWATCDFRDFRTAPPSGQRFTGRKDLTQIYVAIRLMKLRKREMRSSSPCKTSNTFGIDNMTKDAFHLNKNPNRFSSASVYDVTYNSKSRKNKDLSRIFESPSPLHDTIVCWIDQHQVQSREGVKRLQIFIVELIEAGIFYPQVYVRQLLVSGIVDSNGYPADLDRRRRHYRVLKQLPDPYIRDALEAAQIAEGSLLCELMNIYSNERRLVLRGLLDHNKGSGSASSSLWKQRFCRSSGGDAASPPSVDQWRSLQVGSSFTVKGDDRLEDLKASISTLLQLPSSSLSTDSGFEASLGSARSSNISSNNKIDIGEGTPGCEECRKVKRQKLNDDRSSYVQGYSHLDEDEIWWARKGQKPIESYKVDPPPKPTKQAGRGRQKGVRKTQSLAQLANVNARIEGSQGASTSHVCDSRVNCPHHKTGVEGDVPKSMDGVRMPCNGDVVSIREELKQLRFVEKRALMLWLVGVVKQLVGDAEKTANKVGQYSRQFSAVDDRSSVRWKLGEDELSSILYLMDVSDDLISSVRFLLWLLPKVLSNPVSSVHGGRNILMLPRNSENLVCEVGEAFVVSCFRRYENIIAAADLVPETLRAAMLRVAAMMANTGRVSGSSALVYARQLLKKFCSVPSVLEWEKSFKSTCDKRLNSELDSGRLSDGDFGFPLGVPSGVEDLDDFFRQKITGVRVSRVGLTMREIVQRQVDGISHYFHGKERKVYAPGAIKSSGLDKLDDGYQVAQQIVIELMDCMRQTGGAAQEGDPSLVSSAISVIVSSVGTVVAKIPDLAAANSHLNVQLTTSALIFARRILRLHVLCLCLLKDALGERQSRVFEVALATEASNALAQAFISGKAPRGQFQQSPESHDSSSNSPYDAHANSTKPVLGRTAKITGAISAFVIGTILQGVTSLERMVMLFRLREGLDPIQFMRSMKSNSNGNARSIPVSKQDNSVEVSAHWFRVLVGNCRTVSDGFVLDLLGEASVVALSRMQRTLPVNLVFPPAYSIFAFVIWKVFIFNSGVGARDDGSQLYQSLALAMGDAIKHLPFREVCLRDTYGLYDLIAKDTLDSEFAALLDSNGLEMLLKATAFVPLRARLFLNSIIDCKLPLSILKPDDGNRMYGQGESKVHYAEKDAKLMDKLVHVLDTLQPAKFHWQWIELRLLLNEQAIIEKLGSHDTSLVEAIRSISPNPDKVAASENENNFVEIILTRLLVRPDAAPLFSEVVHLLGRSLEDSMLLQAKWFLGGNDVLLGRKSIRQRLINIAESRFLSIKSQYWKPWGWSYSGPEPVKAKGKKRKSEVTSIEEGEFVDEVDLKVPGRGSSQGADVEGLIISQQNLTERAFIELILPCVDQGSDDSRNKFASDMIKQMNNIEQQINSLTRGATKPAGSVPSGIESPGSKSNSRKGLRGGSPGLARRSTGATESIPPSPSALRASMSLRLQFLVRLLPIICSDGEPSGRNMRHTLASVILRLLGSRAVHEDASHTFSSSLSFSKRDAESLMEASATASVVLCGESLFDRLLLVLHGLLSSFRPGWLKLKSVSKSTSESGRDFSMFDREMAENLQNDLDRMQLPDPIRWRIQTAMPILFPSARCLISCQPPSVSTASVAVLLPCNQISGMQPSNAIPPQRNTGSLARAVTNAAGKCKPPPMLDSESEVDPWTLLEDGAGAQSSNNAAAVGGSSDSANLKASNLLKGAVRVRRTDLTYIGAIDEDS